MQLLFPEHLEYLTVSAAKAHDPEHDLDTLIRYGSFLNLDEMNFEQCHQPNKNQGHLINDGNVEKALIIWVGFAFLFLFPPLLFFL